MRSIDTTIIYERKRELREHVLYVIPIESILGRLPVVLPLGDTGTISHANRAEFPGSGDGIRCWFVNNWAMAWSREV